MAAITEEVYDRGLFTIEHCSSDEVEVQILGMVVTGGAADHR
jgi:hypothetical protein